MFFVGKMVSVKRQLNKGLAAYRVIWLPGNMDDARLIKVGFGKPWVMGLPLSGELHNNKSTNK